MTTTDIDPGLLTRTAFDILVSDLEGYGNVLSAMHRAALYELLDTFTGYCIGTHSGRRAFPLPTGTGKTSAVVSFLTAVYRLGYAVPVSVAASRVEALCRLKQDLVARGVPEGLVGLRHSLPPTAASEPSTGNDSRLFQLVTHARVRSGKDRDFELFGTHQGTPRALCIYDETLMRSDSFAFREVSTRKALACLEIELEKKTDPLSTALLAYLGETSRIIAGALEELRGGADPNANGIPVSLPFLDEVQVEAYRDAVGRVRAGLGAWAVELEALLAVSQDDLQVLNAEQGGGVVTVREAVPAALRNVVILDASTPVRELVHLDSTVTAVESFKASDLKSYEDVQVHQLLAAGGRGAIEGSFSAKTKEASAVSREVVDIIKENDGGAKAFLVFSFLPRRGQVDVLGGLKNDLTAAGIDLRQRTAEDKPRFEFLTWGNQEGLNGYEHCDVVIMAGVLHRNHLDLAAAIKGQVAHLMEPTPSDRLRRVIESEVAHVVLQGASRGSCRRIRDGKALPMKLYLIHRNPGLKTILDDVMPGAAWYYPDPKHLKKAAGEGKAALLLGQLLAYLHGLQEDVQKRSSREIKRDLGIGTDNPSRLAFGRACELLDPDLHGWMVEGRSLVRTSTDHGFTDRT